MNKMIVDHVTEPIPHLLKVSLKVFIEHRLGDIRALKKADTEDFHPYLVGPPDIAGGSGNSTMRAAMELVDGVWNSLRIVYPSSVLRY